MTTPFERTRSLIETKHFLQESQDPQLTPRVPTAVREIARKLLRHYPSYADVELAHKALPNWYGPVPPFSRMCGDPQTVGVIEAATPKERQARERNIEILRRLTKPQTLAESERLGEERMREILLRQGRTEAEVAALLARKA